MDSEVDTKEVAPEEDDSKRFCMSNVQRQTIDQYVGVPHVDQQPASRDKALIVEDVRIAEEQFSTYGFATNRLTHNELMALGGTG